MWDAGGGVAVRGRLEDVGQMRKRANLRVSLAGKTVATAQLTPLLFHGRDESLQSQRHAHVSEAKVKNERRHIALSQRQHRRVELVDVPEHPQLVGAQVEQM